MKTIAIVQARMGSSRLPGKVLAEIAGETMLGRVVGRVRAAREVDEVVVATTTAAADDDVVREAARHGAGVFRGAEDDVLARYLGAARTWGAGVIVRVTADCPLLDPEVVDAVVRALRGAREVDYASNTHVRSYPRGLDAEAFYLETLVRIDGLATSPSAREHVTSLVLDAPERFEVRQVRAPRDDSDLRWTVDTADDLLLVRTLYERLGLGTERVPYQGVVAAMRADPALGAINAHVAQKPWRELEHVA